jgi:hypothetical protein
MPNAHSNGENGLAARSLIADRVGFRNSPVHRAPRAAGAAQQHDGRSHGLQAVEPAPGMIRASAPARLSPRRVCPDTLPCCYSCPQMRTACTHLSAGALLVASLLLALGQESSSGADIRLTCLTGHETISRHASYPITWTAQNIPPNTVLSLRIQWTNQNSGVQVGGVPQATQTSWLIGMVFDSATQKRMASMAPSAMNFPAIESGQYLWDVDKFCRENRQGNRSVFDAGTHYRLQAILRSANDPCADRMQCGKPRSLFKVYASDGTFAFGD